MLPKFLTAGRLLSLTALRPAFRASSPAGLLPDDLADLQDQKDWFGNMQGNILKAHGRPDAVLVMFRFGADLARNRAFVRSWETDQLITSTWKQLSDQADRKAYLKDPAAPVKDKLAALGLAPFCSFTITRSGVIALDLAKVASQLKPLGLEQVVGMETLYGRQYLSDIDPARGATPARDNWQDRYKSENPIDAIALLAHADPVALQAMVTAAETRAGQFGVTKLNQDEKGFAWKPPSAGGDLKEPFGFTDGINNPIFFQEDADPRNAPPRTPPMDQVVLQTPAELAGGSYLVFRKLRQNVDQLKTFEDGLRTKLGRPMGTDAADLLVGRQRDGTPLEPAGPQGRNDFQFSTDRADPPRCPFHAHIRKANSRERDSVVLVRRSMVYAEDGAPDQETLGGERGLLFLAYMQDPVAQFERLHTAWLMKDDAQETGLSKVGVDPLLAQPGEYSVRLPGGDEITLSRDDRLVMPLGGRYCFVPPLSWFRALPV